MNLPSFQTTEEAIAFGVKHRQDPEVLKALADARATFLTLVKVYIKPPKTTKSRDLAMHHAFRAQLCREALEGAAEANLALVEKGGQNED